MNKFILTEKLKPLLLEDLQFGDLTSEAIFQASDIGEATITAKADGILSGSSIIPTAFSLLDPSINVKLFKNDREKLAEGDKIASIEGSIQHILTGERVILNLLQRMSGIATLTNQAISFLNSEQTRICDTRKTTPGLRGFEKYAVTCGGGYNHRNSVNDGVMIKDNHIAFCGSITEAVEKVRKTIGPMVKVEVETETEEQVKEAVAAGVDLIMFDNRTAEEIAHLIKLVPSHIITEASGGITMDTLHTYQHSGVDYISLGFLTHSVQGLDMSLNINGGI